VWKMALKKITFWRWLSSAVSCSGMNVTKFTLWGLSRGWMCCISCSLYAHLNLLCTSCTILFGICNWWLTCRTERFRLCWNATWMRSMSSCNVLGLPGECPFKTLLVSWNCWYHLRICLSVGASFQYTHLHIL
jgi:hypothetical protein